MSPSTRIVALALFLSIGCGGDLTDEVTPCETPTPTVTSTPGQICQVIGHSGCTVIPLDCGGAHVEMCCLPLSEGCAESYSCYVDIKGSDGDLINCEGFDCEEAMEEIFEICDEDEQILIEVILEEEEQHP